MASIYAELLKQAETSADARRLRKLDETQFSVEVVVTALEPELGVAVALGEGGLELHIRDTTPGARLGELREGRRPAIPREPNRIRVL